MIMDDKTRVAVAGLLATILVQFLHSKNVEWIDTATANAICLAIVGLAATLIGAHAHVEHAETMADAHVEAAATTARGAVNAAAATAPAETNASVTVNTPPKP